MAYRDGEGMTEHPIEKIHPLDLAEVIERLPDLTIVTEFDDKEFPAGAQMKIGEKFYVQDATIPRTTQWRHWIF